MTILDLDALSRAPLRRDPCNFVVVPHFVRAEVLAEVNRDYPDIAEPGNFEPEKLHYGPSFARLLEELASPELRQAFASKLDIDLDAHPQQLTVRKYSEESDGNVHNDSSLKVVTVLIYFNEVWPHEGGRLRLTRSLRSLDDYAAEVVPEAGMLLAFRRNERSYHGFKAFVGERRSLQMYWVSPKRTERDSEKKATLKRRIKRWLKQRSR